MAEPKSKQENLEEKKRFLKETEKIISLSFLLFFLFSKNSNLH